MKRGEQDMLERLRQKKPTAHRLPNVERLPPVLAPVFERRKAAAQSRQIAEQELAEAKQGLEAHLTSRDDDWFQFLALRRRGQTDETRSECGHRLWADTQARTRRIITAEAALSVAASEARRMGSFYHGVVQSSRFSEGDVAGDDENLAISILKGHPTNCDEIYAWIRDPNLRPPYETGFREWNDAEFPDLCEVYVGEEYIDTARGKKRRRLDKWQVQASKAWTETVERYELARPLMRAEPCKKQRSAKAPKRPIDLSGIHTDEGREARSQGRAAGPMAIVSGGRVVGFKNQ